MNANEIDYKSQFWKVSGRWVDVFITSCDTSAAISLIVWPKVYLFIRFDLFRLPFGFCFEPGKGSQRTISAQIRHRSFWPSFRKISTFDTSYLPARAVSTPAAISIKKYRRPFIHQKPPENPIALYLAPHFWCCPNTGHSDTTQTAAAIKWRNDRKSDRKKDSSTLS